MNISKVFSNWYIFIESPSLSAWRYSLLVSCWWTNCLCTSCSTSASKSLRYLTSRLLSTKSCKRYQLGLSKLKPNTIDIYTNNETQKTHRIKIANQNLILRKPRMKIDKFNASVLCFLELMNGIDTETLEEYKRKLISDYIAENRITQRLITKYIPYFPDKTCRNLIESEVIYRVPK